MQIYFIINALVLYAVFIVPTMVSADQMVRFVFNNGLEPSTPVCNPKENAMIDALFLPKATRRHLRHLKTKKEDVNIEKEADPYMVSATTASKCSDWCIGVKSCRVTGCLGYDGTIKRIPLRRRLRHLKTKKEDVNIEKEADPYMVSATTASKCSDWCIGVKSCRVTGCLGYDGTIKRIPLRGLQSLCDSKILDIGKKLDALPVSTSCKNYWQHPSDQRNVMTTSAKAKCLVPHCGLYLALEIW